MRAISLDEIRRARERIGDAVTRTPLVLLDADAPGEIWLKLECLQPIGSFKLRGALAAIRAAAPQELEAGVVTASAGNMAQGVAWAAREAGVRARIVVPEHAPRAKLDAVERLGGELILVPHEVWWRTIVEGRFEGVEGLFVHPVDDAAVIAGNGTIGLELVEDLEQFDAVVVPWGGGGLATGIASAVKALLPSVRVVTAEPETAAPLAAALPLGEPTEIDYRPSFVDGAGGRALLPAMWERARELVDAAVAMPLDEVAAAMRLLASRARVVAEGAGALALAAAVRGAAGEGRVVCIVSGGNVDAAVLALVLAGETPQAVQYAGK
ncbi:MAG: threonine dehydratase [Actinomycetota bacterium]